MASDATVQYHLAPAYLAVDNDQDAPARFQQVAKLTDLADSREFVTASQLEVTRIGGKNGQRAVKVGRWDLGWVLAKPGL